MIFSNSKVSPLANQRLGVVDSLRGFALIAIVLLHSIEHYNLFYPVEWQPQWLNTIDKHLTEVVWFLLAGKAYATFSLLFGFSFYVQLRNARRRGEDFRARFAWRMVILAAFAQLHALFYNGDILLFYSVCGLVLIPAASWSNRTVLIVALVLLLQPVDWAHMIIASFDAGYVDLNSRFAVYAASAEQVAMHGNFLQTLANNIGNGQLYSNFWQIEAGRITQTPALFLLGMWLGRTEMFVKSDKSVGFWKRTLVFAVFAAAVIYVVRESIVPTLENTTWICHFGIALTMPFNFCMMAALVSLFVLFWFKAGDGFRFQRLPLAYGRMSLTNYITQSIIGVALFYNFGLGLYPWCGSTLSFIIALCVVGLQSVFSRYWLKSHPQGPLEAIWKRLTWIRFKPLEKSIV